jgi:uncharacterized membrane protein YfcA
LATAGTYGAGVYGGYFGAAQGILLISILAFVIPDDLQRLNALKNVLTGLVNLVAGVVFIIVADIAWEAALLIAAGSVVGGALGARYGRRLPPSALRAVIVVVGTVAIVDLARHRGSLADSRVQLVGFESFSRDDLDTSVRIFGPGATLAEDLEPEYIAVSDNGRKPG